MENQQLNVVLASDDNYALWMGMVIVSSLEKTCLKKSMCFYVIDGGISQNKKNKIEEMVNSCQSSIKWISPRAEDFEGLPIKRYGIATYYRLLLGHLLPKDMRRVIYLDCDLLVADDLKNLWNHDLNGNVLGAVENLGIASPSLDIDRKHYFNAGVLLIDMCQWREQEIDKKLITMMKEVGDKYRYLDQDVLNMVFRHSWSRLHLRWNMQPSIWAKLEKSQCHITGYAKADYLSSLENPGIIHFLAQSKPWSYAVFHPYKEVYKKYFTRFFSEYDFYSKISYREKIRKIANFGKILKNQKRICRSSKIFYSRDR